MTELYLGTHEPAWLGRSPLPLFVSIARAARFGRRCALAGWSLDSGGFTRLHQGGWTTSAAEHLDAVYQLSDRVPGIRWAAPQDWMCEPSALAATGRTVDEHQHLTVDNFLELREIDERHLIIPVVQGWAPGDHERCVDLYTAAGVDLRDYPVVGIGTICRRQDTSEIHAIVRSLRSHGLNMHGFGVKSGGIERYGHLLTSADSLAWSYRARRAAGDGDPPLCGGQHRSCANCYRWAHIWHSRIVDRIGTGVEQLELPL